jgi:hypothetical protein
MPTAEIYKVKKGDTLASIAKSFGHKKWETIWNAAENKPLASKRKKPEAIEPGDQLTIPPNEAQRKQAENLSRSLDEQVERLTRQIKLCDLMIECERKTTEKIVGELEDNLKSMKKLSNGVDTAAAVATSLFDMRKDITELAILGKKAIGKHGEELKKIGKEALAVTKDLTKDFAKDNGAEKIEKSFADLLKEHKESSNAVIAFVGCMADAFEKITEPSFWAGTITQLIDGKSWSEAVSTDLEKQLEGNIQKIEADSAQRVRQFQAKRDQLAAQLQQAKTIGKQAAQNHKGK